MLHFGGTHLPSLLRDLPGMTLYALTGVVLVLKMFVVAGYTGAVKMRVGGSPNPEDHPGRETAVAEHPDVARCHRAHRNDLENIPTFLILGLTAVLVGVPLVGLWICFGAFVVARVAHSIFYLSATQPWRSRSYGVGMLATLALMVLVLVRVL